MLARLLAAAVVALAADPALAEMAMRIPTPTTFQEGMLAGLWQPVVVLHHLAIVVAVGCIAAMQPGNTIGIIVYALTSVVGVWAHIGEKTVANAEIFVALTAVAFGLLIFRKNPLRRDIVFALFAAAGLINGYLMGAPVAAAAREPALAYLIGLIAIQPAIAQAVMLGVQALAGRDQLQLLVVRVIGAFAVGAGAALLLQRYAGGA